VTAAFTTNVDPIKSVINPPPTAMADKAEPSAVEAPPSPSPAKAEDPVDRDKSNMPSSVRPSPKDQPSPSPSTSAHSSHDAEVPEKDDPSEDSDISEGEAVDELPPADGAPPLPSEPPPTSDDGWDCLWSAEHESWYFYNRFTQQLQWENPRVPTAAAQPAAQAAAGGYNPAIHGDFDPNADYAQGYRAEDGTEAGAGEDGGPAADPSLLYVSGGFFNRESGKFQRPDQGPDRHGDEAKSRRQMHAFFDVDAAANAHDGRSLKAERSGKKISKTELKAFKEKRRVKKEQKRRAWLKD
jgi:hypothetical protein